MNLLLLAALLALTACTTSPTKPTPSKTPPMATEVGQESSPVDPVAIQRALHLDRNVEQLGVEEKSFNSCEMGYGYSRNKDCRTMYMTVLNVRLLCRDTEGTISTVLTESDVTPIAGQTIRWSLKNVQGEYQTDGLGYGQIVALSPRSQKRERVRISYKNEFLYMRANEITKVITPRPWCSM
ncbi:MULTISPECIES: hypothetical protein [unclassified Bdellovibrio]|uniref:hypothetical protein n=1 Tax=unclassified Bdellovibrio TaxID=2633795 RepID=UPI00115B61D3|nr:MULTISPECIES: hypothetical protein [unclassified Bdellovibrio]QDK44501.1 hypothetical protein DOM22_04675 [Bdellovibrio sp. ZAP7]QLY26325.1 hypothetical protein HW988_04660 [Bdellovibrio sp. KM01]